MLWTYGRSRWNPRSGHGLSRCPGGSLVTCWPFAEKLAEEADTLGEPYARHLGGKVRELRISLHPLEMRVTYWLAPERRVVLLTVFRKTRDQETAQVERAHRVQQECEASHGHAQEVFDREV